MLLQTKLFELRDKGTMIPVAATRFIADNSPASYPLRRAGYGLHTSYVMVVKLTTNRAETDPYAWGDRTMLIAHNAIEKQWDRLASGAVVDVEFELGITATPKTSEAREWPVAGTQEGAEFGPCVSDVPASLAMIEAESS